MSILHSNENIPDCIGPDDVKQCSICKKDYEIDETLVATHCGHVFHRECIIRVLAETHSCPVCFKLCRQTTLRTYNFPAEVIASASGQHSSNDNINRNATGTIPKDPQKKKNYKKRNQSNPNRSQTTEFNRNYRNQEQLSTENLVNISQRNVNTLNNSNLHNQLNVSEESLQHLIDEAVSRQLAFTHISQNTYRDSFGTRNFDNQPNRIASTRPNNVRTRNPRSFEFTTDRIPNIISGWRLVFSGEDEDFLSVDEFIYRVNALTIQSLRGDFDSLCRHVQLLFRDKALHWYWRYHRTTARLDWNSICTELGKQFRDRRTDYDFLDQLHGRKLKVGERFDPFYDAILQITDRLQSPLHESEMVEILKRNLRPEVRKGLLHFYIGSVSKLREFVRKYEILEDELNPSPRINRTMLSRRNVSELETHGLAEEDNGQVDEIKELICWNCSEPGHKYDECMAERKVFCYGCGAPNTYKPSCTKCNKFPKNCHAQSKGKQIITKPN